MRTEFPDHFKAGSGKGCLGVLLLVMGSALPGGMLHLALAGLF